MYEHFFGLRKSPFAMTPDSSAILLTEGHREALAGLSYALMRRKGFVVLIGEAGLGKTTLLRRLTEMVPETSAHTSVVFNPTLTPSEFLELLLFKFGVEDLPDSKARRLILLENLLKDAHDTGRVPVLIIDEAHKLSSEVLEEIRLLTNFESNDHKMLQIVLAGQPELGTLLNRHDLWQLKQRVALRLHLRPLSQQHVGEYIGFRWARAGGSLPSPLRDVVTEIGVASRGIPRVINAICDNALLAAFGAQSRVVTKQEVRDVLRDLDIGAAQKQSAPASLNIRRPGVAAQAPGTLVSAARPVDVPVAEQAKTELLSRWSARLRA